MLTAGEEFRMTKPMCRAAVFVMLCASVLGGRPVQGGSRTGKTPYLVIRPDGIDVVARGIVSGRKTVSVTELQRTLIELPLTAWPYGRVVGVQEIGVRAGDRSADQPVANNLQAALTILKTL